MPFSPIGGAAILVIVAGSWASGQEEQSSDTSPDETPPPRPRRQIVDPDLVPSAGRSTPGTVEIEGLVSLSEEDARDEIRLQVRKLEENGVTMARADDAAFFLEKVLRGRGHDEAVVDWAITGNQTVTLSVKEGREVRFGEVNVSGNEHLQTEAIRELLTQATRKRLGYRIDSTEIPYVASDVEEGIGAARHLYQLLGFASVEITLEDSNFNPESEAIDLSLVIDEGIQSQIGEIRFPTPPIELIGQAYPAIEQEFVDKPFTDAVRANLENRVLEEAKKAGFIEAEVKLTTGAPRLAPPEPEEESSAEASESATHVSEVELVDLEIEVDWGPQFTLSRVDVTGIKKIADGVVERRFSPLVGEIYSPERANQELTSLLESGAFESITMEPLPQVDGTLALAIEATESMQRALGVYGGFGTYEGVIIGLEYRNTNFRHRLHTLQAALELNGRGLRGDIELADPRFLDSRWKFLIGLDSKNESHEGYDIFDVGFKIGFQREFGRLERHRITFFGNPRYQEITDADIPDEFLGPQDYVVSQLGFLYSFDGRDDPVSPRKGFAADLVLAGANDAIGSEVNFGKAALKTAYHLPIGATTLRLGARAGIIDSSDDELPIDLRFFSGGARSVRSFRERDLGPKAPGGYPVGGEFVTVFNFEYEIPVAGPLSVAPFLDAGNLLRDADDASLDDMHYAGGAGLILNSPIGPFRIDYGHNLNPGSKEPEGSWHVGFGFSF